MLLRISSLLPALVLTLLTAFGAETPPRIEDIKGKTILLFTPHPDDDAFCCGGTLALLAKNGNTIRIVIYTNDDKGSYDLEMTGERLDDIVWLHLEGRAMADDDWQEPQTQAVGMYLNGQGIAGTDGRGQPITDDHFLLYFNADGEATATLPSVEYAEAWDVVIDTAGPVDPPAGLAAGSTLGHGVGSGVVAEQGASTLQLGQVGSLRRPAVRLRRRRRHRVTGDDAGERLSLAHRLTDGDQHLADVAGDRRGDRVLHLHDLEHHDGGPGGHRSTGLDLDHRHDRGHG